MLVIDWPSDGLQPWGSKLRAGLNEFVSAFNALEERTPDDIESLRTDLTNLIDSTRDDLENQISDVEVSAVQAAVDAALETTVPSVRGDLREGSQSLLEPEMGLLFSERGVSAVQTSDLYRSNASSSVFLPGMTFTLLAGESYHIEGRLFIDMEPNDGGGTAHPGIKLFWSNPDSATPPSRPLTWFLSSTQGTSPVGGFADTLSVSPGVPFGSSGWIDVSGRIDVPADYSLTLQLGCSKNIARNSNFTVREGSYLVAKSVPPVVTPNQSNVTVGSRTFTLQTPAKPWSFLNSDGVVRIELRSGDRWPGDQVNSIGSNDRRERCELVGPYYPNGTDVWIAYDFRYFGDIEDLEIQPDSYLFISQAIARGAGPVLSAQLNISNPSNPTFSVGSSYVPAGGGNKIYNPGWSVPLWAEGEIQRFVFHVVTGIDNDATLEIWRNGVKEFEAFNINIGQEHPTNVQRPSYKFGQYRGRHRRFVTEYAHLEIGTSSLLGRVSNPLPWPS